MNASFFRISGTRKELRKVWSTVYASRSWTLPPAASICSRAVAENPWACTVSAFVSSPAPRIFTGTSRARGKAERLQASRA